MLKEKENSEQMITKMKENVDPILSDLPIMTTVDVSKKLAETVDGCNSSSILRCR